MDNLGADNLVWLNEKVLPGTRDFHNEYRQELENRYGKTLDWIGLDSLLH